MTEITVIIFAIHYGTSNANTFGTERITEEDTARS